MTHPRAAMLDVSTRRCPNDRPRVLPQAPVLLGRCSPVQSRESAAPDLERPEGEKVASATPQLSRIMQLQPAGVSRGAHSPLHRPTLGAPHGNEWNGSDHEADAQATVGASELAHLRGLSAVSEALACVPENRGVPGSSPGLATPKALETGPFCFSLRRSAGGSGAVVRRHVGNRSRESIRARTASRRRSRSEGCPDRSRSPAGACGSASRSRLPVQRPSAGRRCCAC